MDCVNWCAFVKMSCIVEHFSFICPVRANFSHLIIFLWIIFSFIWIHNLNIDGYWAARVFNVHCTMFKVWISNMQDICNLLFVALFQKKIIQYVWIYRWEWQAVSSVRLAWHQNTFKIEQRYNCTAYALYISVVNMVSGTLWTQYDTPNISHSIRKRLELGAEVHVN